MGAHWFTNLSIRGKLFFGFGAVLALFIGMLAIALMSMDAIYDEARTTAEIHYPRADAANDLIKEALVTANSYRDLAFSDNPAENREDMAIIRKSRTNIEVLIHRFDNMKLSKEEQALLIPVRVKLEKLNAQFDIFFKLLKEDKAKLGEFIPNEIAPASDSLIQSLQVMEDYQAAKTLANAEQAEEKVRQAAVLLALLGVLGIVLAAVMGFILSRTVAGAVQRSSASLTEFVGGWRDKAAVATAISEGDFSREVALSTPLAFDPDSVGSDETGRLLRTIAELSTVQIEFDSALSAMNRSLRSKAEEDAQRAWQKNGESELNLLLRGELNALQIADAALKYLANYLEANAGVLYLLDADKRQLRLVASHAFTRRKQLGDSIEIGEGLVGQVARDQKTICWIDVPAGYMPVASALGEASPSNAIALPIRRESRLLGVVELGTFARFDDRQIGFLEQALESVAVALDVAESRQSVDRLLAETQRQAATLQAQQELLQQTNDELGARSKLLEQQKREVDAKNVELAAATEEIERKAADLERVSNYKSQFLANMSHELRTPLNSITILSQLLKENKDGTLTDRQQEFAATISGAARDLLTLINDILDLSRVEAGRMQLHIEPVDLQAVMTSLEAEFRPQAERKGLNFAIDVAQGAPAELDTDMQRLRQVLRNLLSNAVKFTESGSVTVSIVPAPADNPLHAPAIAFAVRDTGIGIPADKYEHVFEAFQQVDGTTSRRFGGTGLGLSIARQLSYRLGGDIVLESQEGRGSVFTLLMPRAGTALTEEDKRASAATVAAPRPVASHLPPREKPAAMNPAVEPVAPDAQRSAATHASLPLATLEDDRTKVQPGSRSILVIEDDAPFAAILRDMVRDKGFAAIVASDGESACALAEALEPSAILLDVMLPGMDGWSVMRRLKDHPRTRHIPVHFITCLDDSGRALRMGAVGFVTKPVSQEQLDMVFTRIGKVLERDGSLLMIVDDDDDEARELSQLLGEGGVDIRLAHSGAEAEQMIAENNFDCVVLDLDLADESPFAILDELLDREEAERPPVIVYARRPLGPGDEESLRSYADRVVIKDARSREDLLHDVCLFLHVVEKELPAEKRRMIRQSQEAQEDFSGAKILIADDDMRSVFSLSSILAERGVQPVTAENGEEALARLSEHPDIDLVLMDVMMPVMDGCAAMSAIRADDRYSDIPLIAMTAKALAGDRETCLEAGADDYIAKPIDMDSLLAMIDAWIYQRRGRQ